jgi:hypothetical protein
MFGFVIDEKMSRLRAMILQLGIYRNNKETDEETGGRT